MPSVNYEKQVWCTHCGDKHEKTECKFIPNWGFKCPYCGCKCRVKPKWSWKNYIKKHPYVPSRSKQTMVTEIREIAKETKRLV